MRTPVLANWFYLKTCFFPSAIAAAT